MFVCVCGGKGVFLHGEDKETCKTTLEEGGESERGHSIGESTAVGSPLCLLHPALSAVGPVQGPSAQPDTSSDGPRHLLVCGIPPVEDGETKQALEKPRETGRERERELTPFSFYLIPHSSQAIKSLMMVSLPANEV